MKTKGIFQHQFVIMTGEIIIMKQILDREIQQLYVQVSGCNPLCIV